MDNSKVQMLNPKISLHIWSNPHSNTGIAIIVKNNTFVKLAQDYVTSCKSEAGFDLNL